MNDKTLIKLNLIRPLLLNPFILLPKTKTRPKGARGGLDKKQRFFFQ
jgi:hypothetical protein